MRGLSVKDEAVLGFGGFMGLMFCRQTNGFADLNVTQDEDLHYSEVNVFGYANWVSSTPLMVGLTLIGGAAAKGAGFPHLSLNFHTY